MVHEHVAECGSDCDSTGCVGVGYVLKYRVNIYQRAKFVHMFLNLADHIKYIVFIKNSLPLIIF